MESNDPEENIEGFYEWLEQVAISENTTHEDVLHQLMSSYWVLHELSTVLDDTQFDINQAEDHRNNRTSRSDRSQKSDRSSDSSANHSDIIDVINSLREWDESNHSADREVKNPSIDPELLHLIHSLLQSTDSEHTDSLDEIEPHLAAEIEAIKATIKSLEEQIEASNEVADYLEGVIDRLDTQTRADIDDLSTEIANRVEHTRLESLDRFGTIETIYNDTFETVKQILSHLIDQTDELASRTDELTRTINIDVQPLIQTHDDHIAVQDLKENANRSGIRSATCGSCDSTIDIGLLTRPICPSCKCGLDTLTTKVSFWRTTHILTSQSRQPSTGTHRFTNRSSDRVTEPQKDTEEQSRDGFVWNHRNT